METKGWKLLCGMERWYYLMDSLSSLKESNTVDIAEYAVAHGLTMNQP
jgi:hypothetical protein